MKLGGLAPSSYIPVSVSDLYISTLGPEITQERLAREMTCIGSWALSEVGSLQNM
jgi:hypothetical protein